MNQPPRQQQDRRRRQIHADPPVSIFFYRRDTTNDMDVILHNILKLNELIYKNITLGENNPKKSLSLRLAKCHLRL